MGVDLDMFKTGLSYLHMHTRIDIDSQVYMHK